ncbi:MAG: OmpA family protein [Saprospiraceae bacterium]|nr:OmpA family protein [Saprospiraceae bacterium]MCF8250894.1 OmpA family protein [Saprospiraceae bacterium]MCF8281150.1 OmpA family protein [Bacteroidales bacterium]MCF8312705.1 OmpA family protein [Saprospiraceae bacterium]MCF8441152.1 OmpA family protein [Saprospiraceae bacterium]
MIRAISFLFLISLCGNAFAQNKITTTKTANGKLKTMYERAARIASLGQFDDAIEDLDKALKIDPSFIDAQIEWANVKYQQMKLEEAEIGYQKALALDSIYEPNIFYSLANVQFDQRKYGDSAANFDYFLKNAPRISPKRRANAEKYLANTKFAAEATKNPVPYEPKNLGPNVNTPDAEYLPTLTADGETLIYTAVRKGQEDFYRSVKIDGEWQPGKPIEAVNTPNNEGAQSISGDGKFLVFTACNRRDGLGGCDLFFAELKNGKWTAVRNLGAPVNSPGWESQPSLSSDGKTLYFTSERKGGKGGKDIWMSLRQPNNKWGTPVNLGAPINTSADDQSPFIHADGQTLYYMSNGLPGMGGYDLYFSRLQPDGKWGEPQNLGYPINTEGNEGALSVSLDGKTAYFATDRLTAQNGVSAFDNPQGKGTTDIYSFELSAADRPQPVTYVQAIIFDAATKKPLVANVEFVELGSGKTYASAETESDGEFLITLPAGGNYALNVSKEKYLFYSENFALNEPGTMDQPFKLSIGLQPVGTGSDGTATKPIVLKNVFFETGSAALRKESLIELARLKKLLDENPTLKIQINGHTDNVGTEPDNLKLSNDRAKAVYDYLTQNGIDAIRLRFKGFGEVVPAASNETEEGRKQNRRTEYEILR